MPTMRPLCHLAALAALGAAPLAGAADLTYHPSLTLHGGPGDLYGLAVRGAGDVDADGVPDVMVYARGGAGSSFVTVVSGATGAELYAFGDVTEQTFGLTAPMDGAGDVNDDGHADLILGDATAGVIRVRSGADGSVLFMIFPPPDEDDVPFSSGFGGAVSTARDVDGDGFDDVIIGNRRGRDLEGYAEVYSGVDGALIETLFVENVCPPKLELCLFNHLLGGAVADAGDVDGDDVPDLIVGAEGDGVPVIQELPPFIGPHLTDQDEGAARVFSGATGLPILELVGDAPFQSYGYTVAAAGDVNDDGFDDVIVGSRSIEEPPFVGYARVHSGADGTVLLDLLGEPGTSWVKVSGLGDVNADDHDDVLVGFQAGSVFVARVVSGATGETLFEHVEDAATTVGLAVDGLGDVNGDGRADFVVGVSENYFGGGFVQVFVSLATGPGCPADLDESGTVGIGDLLVVLAGWGTPAGDVDGDGVTDTTDLLTVLATWGPCEA